MVLNHKQIVNLPVYTKTETRVGFISHFDVDELEQKIVRYYIKPHQGIASMFGSELLVSPKQVISITREKMIVDDLAIKQTFEENERVVSKRAVPAGG